MKLYKYKDGKCNISGNRIRKYREQLGLSQEQLAANLQLIGLNLNQKAISRIETGERVVPDYELTYFAEIFSCNVNCLLNDNTLSDRQS